MQKCEHKNCIEPARYVVEDYPFNGLQWFYFTCPAHLGETITGNIFERAMVKKLDPETAAMLAADRAYQDAALGAIESEFACNVTWQTA